ncbi:MAG: phosphate ABC transporter, permease protein PstA [Pelagibacterales bacterium]|nr:phosphate ABC transporter, permease protein PstA [Pelagibacterales bacterium]OUV26858.1 MAG: phosphate ABC transporter, permease protein PstA [Alphaproteobacteria bacterium TMED109]
MRKEKFFQFYGIIAILMALSFLIILAYTIGSKGLPGFFQTYINASFDISQEYVDPENTGDEEVIKKGRYRKVFKEGVINIFPEAADNRASYRQASKIFSKGVSYQLRNMVLENNDLIGTKINIEVLASSEIDQLHKGNIDRNLPENLRPVSDWQLKSYDQLIQQGLIKTKFNVNFFTKGDSRNPEEAGILGALVGSALTLLITLVLSFPLGVATAIYLEEFAPKNKLTDIIEININNLAAVPSIVFGLLGLAVILNIFGIPRSIPLAGGLVLTLMTLPTVIISSRASLRSVPPSIREAALGIGASKQQAVFHHVVPSAAPGMFTGTIIGMAQALGETAPLLMMGMVAFIVEVPQSIMDPATVLPAQVYLWADSPERGFEEKTSAAIMTLVVFLIVMNSLAVYCRKKLEKKW